MSPELVGDFMRRRVLKRQPAVLRHFAVCGLALLIGMTGAAAQIGDSRAQDQSGKPGAANAPQSAEAAKDNQLKTDEFAQAAWTSTRPTGSSQCRRAAGCGRRMRWLSSTATGLPLASGVCRYPH